MSTEVLSSTPSSGKRMLSGTFEVASTPERLEELYRFRHEIFVHQDEILKPMPGGRMTDAFDTTSENIVAVVEGRIVATMRLNAYSEKNNNDEYMDFSPFLPGPPAKVHGASIVCVDKAFRSTQVFVGMLGLYYYRVLALGITHLYAIGRAPVIAFFDGQGFEKLMPMQYRESNNVHYFPILLDMQKLGTPYKAFMQQIIDQHGLESPVTSVPFVLNGRRVVLFEE